VAFELSVGPLLCPAKYRKRNEADLDRLLSTVLPLGFSQEDGEYAARVRVTLQKAGTPIGSYDTLLAGQALSRGMTLVSHHTAEFSRVQGLKLVDWSVRS